MTDRHMEATKKVKSVEITAPGKLLLLSIVALGCMGIIVIDHLTHSGGDVTPAWVTLGSIVGYLVGNGVGAKKGVEQAPTFAPKDHP